jgi:hypothetical protein
MINGTWREIWGSQTLVNGVWRDNDSYVNVNGMQRLIHRHTLSEDDIMGFLIVYKLSTTRTHEDYPDLKYNENIPTKIGLTGANVGKMDMTQKGVIFEYSNDNPDEEGIKMYEGALYAMLTNESIIDVINPKDSIGYDERVPGITPEISEVWSTNRTSELAITMTGKMSYEDNGYFIDGWNGLFTKIKHLDESYFPDKDYKSHTYNLEKNIILPTMGRNELFNPIAEIGIVRDMHTSVKNMVGSYGLLDQTISSIIVNGVPKPFVIEIYD